MLFKPKFRFVVYFILMPTLFMNFVSGSCDTNCHWTSWFAWDCSRCCRANLPPPIRFALRTRGICCHNITDTPHCLQTCGFTPLDTKMKGPCVPSCACPTTPVHTPSLSFTRSRIQTTIALEATSSADPFSQHLNVTTKKQTGSDNLSSSTTTGKMLQSTAPFSLTRSRIQTSTAVKATTSSFPFSQHSTVTTEKQAGFGNLSSMITGKVPQACTTESTGTILDPGLPPLSNFISSALSRSGQNDTLECRNECTGVDRWDTCLLECFSRPCTSLLTLVSPCLFILGMIVGSSLTCIIRSLLDKGCKKNSSFVHA